jgi:type II secretory ATPase GspE/PulE/Tfp pilus assembly ATPase PilB-like protein
MAQRLLRKVCAKCKTPHRYDEAELAESGIEPWEVQGCTTFINTGCSACNGSGYKGRTGIYEVLTLDKYIKQSVIDRATAGALRAASVEAGMRTLRMNAVDKFLSGLTTLEEINRVTAVDDPEVREALGTHWQRVRKGEIKPRAGSVDPETKGRLA